jgi:hypothetical protein
MSVFQSTWLELRRRRLLPVAALLVAALVAVPLLLAEDPATPAPVPAAPAEDTVTTAMAEPIVTLRTTPAVERHRRVVGAEKDPFAPAPLPKAKPAATPASTGGAGAGTGAPASPSRSASAQIERGTLPGVSTSAGGSGSGSLAPVLPTTDEPASPVRPVTPSKPAKGPTYPADSIEVAFGDASGEQPDAATVELLAPLPDADTPVVVYLGLQDRGKTAVFLLDDGVQVDGDGTCQPDPATCDRFTLRAGETEFLTVPESEGHPEVVYELDLKAIHHQGDDRPLAGAARVKARAASRRLLRVDVAAPETPAAASEDDGARREPFLGAGIARAVRLGL